MGEAITQIKNIPTETQRSAAFSAKMVSRETDFKIEHSEKLLLGGVASRKWLVVILQFLYRGTPHFEHLLTWSKVTL